MRSFFRLQHNSPNTTDTQEEKGVPTKSWPEVDPRPNLDPPSPPSLTKSLSLCSSTLLVQFELPYIKQTMSRGVRGNTQTHT